MSRLVNGLNLMTLDLFLLLFFDAKKKEARMDLPFIARLGTFLKFSKKLHIVI